MQVSLEDRKRLWLKCRTEDCKYTGPVLHFAFLYGTTLCPKCATEMVYRKGTASSYSRRQVFHMCDNTKYGSITNKIITKETTRLLSQDPTDRRSQFCFDSYVLLKKYNLSPTLKTTLAHPLLHLQRYCK